MHRRDFGKLLVAAGLGQTLSAPGQSARTSTPRSTPKFSCMLWTLTRQYPFDRCLEIVAAAGYTGVELVGEFNKWSPAEYQAHTQRIHALGLTVDATSGIAIGFATPDQTGLFLAQLTDVIHAAETLGCPQIILLSGPRDPALSPAAQRSVALSNLHHAADLAAVHKIELLLEPIDRLENPTIFLDTVADAFSLVRDLNRPKVKVLYDLYHEQRGFGNLTDKLGDNFELIGLIHIADVPGRHEPGTGEINYAHLYRILAELRYDRYLAMEFYPTGDPVATLRVTRQAVLGAYAQP